MSAVSRYGSISMAYLKCYGIRPVISMASDVYIKSGEGTDENPYILGKD